MADRCFIPVVVPPCLPLLFRALLLRSRLHCKREAMVDKSRQEESKSDGPVGIFLPQQALYIYIYVYIIILLLLSHYLFNRITFFFFFSLLYVL